MITEERIAKILEGYEKANCRYLISAQTHFPNAQGTFQVGEGFYYKPRFEHITSIETNLCLNQLCYVAFGDWLTDGKIENLKLSSEEYLEMMKENMFIADIKMRFSKLITKDNQLIMDINLKRAKKVGNIYLAVLDYDFENESSKGEVEFVLKK